MSLSEKKADNPKSTTNFVVETEEERLRRDIYRSDAEKFRLLTEMLRMNAIYKKANVTHR